MWLLNERLVSKSTPRFLTNGEDLTERPSSVRQYAGLIRVNFLCCKYCVAYGFVLCQLESFALSCPGFSADLLLAFAF